MMALHRWSGWPGAWCLDCGIGDPNEQCLADHDHDTDPVSCTVDWAAFTADCKEHGSKRHDPYATPRAKRVNLDDLERLAKAATPGPWTTKPDDDQRKHLLCTETGAWFGVVEASPRNAADAAYIAAAHPAVVLELVRRLRAAEGIVRDLADGGDPISPGIAACAVCRAWQPGAEPMKLTDHDEDCAYRRATEYVK